MYLSRQSVNAVREPRKIGQDAVCLRIPAGDLRPRILIREWTTKYNDRVSEDIPFIKESGQTSMLTYS
jgi:hypothetical protein